MKKKAYIFISIFLCIALVLFVVFFVIYPFGYKSYIEKYSGKYNLDKGLVAAIICVESRYKTRAVSSAGAVGLMQIMPTTASWIAEELQKEDYDLYDPETNIMFGCYYLYYLFSKYKNQVYVLACYNAGESVVSTWGDRQNFSIDDVAYAETKNYIIKIDKLKKFYQSRF